ncbi:hypothetical protein [Nocardia sp. AG03]|uniref:hypothetical protein n=1 Tax=Nocardia sp. AG03 TaxID=3025312 RepID=UPI0024187A11|nr:hypothetical protein [Nocardia sp. AG03]
MNARRGRARPGRYRSLHVHGYRSASHLPILWAFAALIGGVFFLLVVLTIANMSSPDPEEVGVATTIPATVPPPPAPIASAPPPTTQRTCYPFAPAC